VFQEIEFFEAETLEFELVEAAHVHYMGDGDMFKMEDVGDEKVNSWNAMCIYEKIPAYKRLDSSISSLTA
jgi:hypothetical protein